MTAPINAAIYFEADAYDIGQPGLMGRQAAGAAFLRAAVAGRGEDPVVGYGRPDGAQSFAARVAAIDPSAPTRWIAQHPVGRLDGAGVCYQPGPAIGDAARARLRTGAAKFSLCGVTHTTATAGVMRALADLLTDPVMPWDAVICTSDAVAKTVEQLHLAQTDYLRWRLGPHVRIAPPQLPVIPLGVHCDDFVFAPGEREAARRDLDLGDDEIVCLFVGRLAFAGKAHPLQMYQALQAVAARTGKRVTLIQCGWFPTPQIAQTYESAAAQFAPDVRALFADGLDATARRRCWAGADLFISLSDNIQETFGLTPLEAMAAGLPVVVSDWNGYRQTVEDGVHGFRVATWSPGDGAGIGIAASFEAGAIDYDRYCWATVTTTSVDGAQLVDRLSRLALDPDLRRRMGEAGRATARRAFDWSVIYGQYQALWAELTARRLAAAADPETSAALKAAPRSTPDRMDPFRAFGHYPTAQIGPNTVLHATDGADAQRFTQIAGHNLFIGARPPEALVVKLLDGLAAGPLSVADAARLMGCDLRTATLLSGGLAKMGLVRLGAASASGESGAAWVIGTPDPIITAGKC